MSNCNASAFPELAQLLAANEKWANGVSAADPHFFANGAKGQAPKARPGVAERVRGAG